MQTSVKKQSVKTIEVKTQKKNIKKLASFEKYLYLCIVNQDKLVDKPQDLNLAKVRATPWR